MGSKFKGLLDATRDRRQEYAEAGDVSADLPAASIQEVNSPSPIAESATRPLGRPRGKRSDPAYEQITAYIRKETYRTLKIKLLETGDERDASEVIEDVLSAWLNS